MLRSITGPFESINLLNVQCEAVNKVKQSFSPAPYQISNFCQNKKDFNILIKCWSSRLPPLSCRNIGDSGEQIINVFTRFSSLKYLQLRLACV